MSITNVPELFGSMVFNDTVMKLRMFPSCSAAWCLTTL